MRIAAVADLPSRYGRFQVIAFVDSHGESAHAAFVHGEVSGSEDVLVRLHSECLTGDVAGSLRCDCRDQLESSLKQVGQSERGVVLYLRQEGRGIGFANKIRAYALQDKGMDTVLANEALGFRDDEREYETASLMLNVLGVRSIRLLTNNPRKMEGLAKYGVKIAERVPLIVRRTEHSEFYLDTKGRKSGHILDG
ncbi:MAG TPA: GTP cyclohydrolase II [bacterium]|nr:GTP cyclohydrolase II [bacterium]